MILEGLKPEILAVVIVVIILVLLILAVVGWYISTSNTFHKMGIKIDESESGIDVALTKRFDTLTKLFQIAKGYADHERETLTNIAAMRNPGAGASMMQKSQFNDQMAEASRQVYMVAERYPELQANSNFQTLAKASIEIEEQLQSSRRLYNSNISIFNQRLAVFPSSIVGNRMGLVKRDFFEAEESKKKDVEFNF